MDVIAVVIMVLIITIIGLGAWVLHLKRKLYYAEEHNKRLLKELLVKETLKLIKESE